ncbi:MAG: hypothetical protein VX044_09815 [Planctomycetota bacterium]|nr:hypothetical protein [Planctomycetota bacterium]
MTQRRGPGGCQRRARGAPIASVLIASAALVACRARPPREASGRFGPTDAAPIYHVLRDYDRRWRDQVEDGVELARAFWGSYGPVHVWIAGRESDDAPTDAAAAAFLAEYRQWRATRGEVDEAEVQRHAKARFLDVVHRGDAEAYLSWIEAPAPPTAELVFLNVHEWFFAADAIPDPVLRGVHEYTHVFQMAFADTPTWMTEGGAVFAEAWIPWVAGRCDAAFVSTRMEHSMRSARRALDAGYSIADMEDIDAAPPAIRRFYRELAYDAGAWATAYLVHASPTRSVAAMRDEFYPMVREVGWERALCQYTGVADKSAFYADVAAFLAQPARVRRQVLETLQP